MTINSLDPVDPPDSLETKPERTMRQRWDRIVSAITHPFTTNPLSPEGKIGIFDYWWAVKQYCIGFAKTAPEQAGLYFFYALVVIKALVLISLLIWLL